MDLVKSHISGQPFLYPVPHLPTYSSILLRISRGFSSGCKVYIRPSKDVTSTEIRLAAAPTGPSSTHRTGPASFFHLPPEPNLPGTTGAAWTSVLTFFCCLTSSSVPRHGHSDTGDTFGSGCGDGWRQPGSSHPRQPGQRRHPARLGGEHARQFAGAGETQIFPNQFKLSIVYHMLDCQVIFFPPNRVELWFFFWQYVTRKRRPYFRRCFSLSCRSVKIGLGLLSYQ